MIRERLLDCAVSPRGSFTVEMVQVWDDGDGDDGDGRGDDGNGGSPQPSSPLGTRVDVVWECRSLVGAELEHARAWAAGELVPAPAAVT